MDDRNRRVRRPRAPKAPQTQATPTRVVRSRTQKGKTPRNRPSRERQRPARVETDKQQKTRTRSLKFFVLILVLMISFLGFGRPLHQWWAQQREIKSVEYQIEQAKQKNAELEEQLQRWGDKDYVASQARARLNYVMPGETQFRVVDPPGGAPKELTTTEPVHKQGPPRPWYLVVADTVDAADDPDPITTIKPSVQVVEKDEE